MLYDNDDEVVRQYSDMVYRIALSKVGVRHDADDIFQEVFIRYFKKKVKFKDENHRKAWLIRVTMNCSSSFFTTGFRKNTQQLSDDLVFENKEIQDLHYELQKIPKKYRDVIYLFYYEEMSIEEITLILKRKNSTVRTQLTRARKLLKDFMDMEDYYV